MELKTGDPSLIPQSLISTFLLSTIEITVYILYLIITITIRQNIVKVDMTINIFNLANDHRKITIK